MIKKQVNERVLIAINYILKLRPDISKSTMGKLLGLSPTKFSHIMGMRMFVGVEVMTSLCLRFNISADWLLTGRGNMINESEGEQSLDHISIVMQLVNTIKQQAEEIGQLKERIKQSED